MPITTNRRKLLGGLAATAVAPAILTATRAYAQTPTIKIGHVSPRTAG